jgi:hypothetical protein
MKIESTFLLVSILTVLTVTSIAAAAIAPTSIPFFSLSTYSVFPTVQSTSSSTATITSSSYSSSLLLPSFLPNIVQTAKADVDIDTSGNGEAAAFDGKNSISSYENGFCNTVDNMAGGGFASLFKGIVDCKSSENKQQQQQQYVVDYSVIKDPVKVGDTTYMIVSVRDRNTDQPVSDAVVLLTIESPPHSNSDPSVGQTSTTSTSTTQTAYTDKDGHAIFTIHIGPHSNNGIYNTNLEIKKDNYDSKMQKSFHVV